MAAFDFSISDFPMINGTRTISSALEPRNQKKIYKDAKNKTFIGLANPTLNPPHMGMSDADYASSTITFDTTSYIDRALISVKNNGSSSIIIRNFSIRGQQVVRLSGLNGLKWEYLNRRDIETSGEKEYKVTSNFITSGAQCEDVGDYVRKELEPHDMYALTLHGIHPYFEVGDRYELVLDYKLPTMQFPTEQIAVDVEIRGVSIHRAVGSIGETMLSVRVPSGEWNNTTPTKARWIASGRMDQEQNRSNVLTIGAYDYAGTADIYCDGVDDDVEIQAAIDQLRLEGGGTVKLSRGHFIIGDTIYGDGLVLLGEGLGTIISPADNSITIMIESRYQDIFELRDFCIDGSGVEYGTSDISLIYDPGGEYNLVANNIEVKNIAINHPDDINRTFRIFANLSNIIGCLVHDCSIYSGYSIGLIIFSRARVVGASSSLSNASTGSAYIHSFSLCYNLSLCISSLNSCIDFVSFVGCENMSSCKSSGNVSSGIYYGYFECKRTVACSSVTNTGSSVEIGFALCKSAQQCKSDDTSKYGSGATQSYADSGTSNACADTAAGGYNS